MSRKIRKFVPFLSIAGSLFNGLLQDGWDRFHGNPTRRFSNLLNSQFELKGL